MRAIWAYGIVLVSVVAVTNYHKSVALNNTSLLSYSSGGQKFKISLRGQSQGVRRVGSFWRL